MEIEKWRYIEQDGTIVDKTEEQIISEYFSWWSKEMVKVGHADQINHQNCINDWITANWAYKVIAPMAE